MKQKHLVIRIDTDVHIFPVTKGTLHESSFVSSCMHVHNLLKQYSEVINQRESSITLTNLSRN